MSKWVSVEDRLPQDERRCLVWGAFDFNGEENLIFVAWYDKKHSQWWCAAGGDDLYHVRYWRHMVMPPPEA